MAIVELFGIQPEFENKLAAAGYNTEEIKKISRILINVLLKRKPLENLDTINRESLWDIVTKYGNQEFRGKFWEEFNHLICMGHQTTLEVL